MTQISYLHKQLLERQFGMADGYVLDFSNNSFQRFVKDSTNQNIYDSKFAIFGESKANRLRAFFELEDAVLTAKLIGDLLQYIQVHANLGNPEMKSRLKDADLHQQCMAIHKEMLVDQKQDISNGVDTFLSMELDDVTLSSLFIEEAVIQILEQRMTEVKKCLSNGASLSVIFLCGSMLEGILIGIATKCLKEFNQASTCPKDKEGKPKLLRDWSLSHLIDVAHEIGFIGLDVKKYSHSLRDFRNFIHPHEQVKSGFNPDHHTAKISWHVLKAAIQDIIKKQKNLVEMTQPNVANHIP